MWALAGNALILVENLSVPFDRRVWQESTTLRDATLTLRGVVLSPDGSRRIEAEIAGPMGQAQALGDFAALKQRRRRALRVNLGSDTTSGLNLLAEALRP